jgi:hypothetical protein
MKKALLSSILIFLSFSKIKAQDSLRVSARLDSFPTITIKKNPPLFALSIISGYWLMGANANEYTIGKEKYLSNRPIKPFYEALGDKQVMADYQAHRRSRTLYMIGQNAGILIYLGGIIQNISITYSSRSIVPDTRSSLEKGGYTILLGAGVMLTSAIIRINSFAHLRKANQRYNELISKPKTSFDIKPSQEGLGLGLRMSF